MIPSLANPQSFGEGPISFVSQEEKEKKKKKQYLYCLNKIVFLQKKKKKTSTLLLTFVPKYCFKHIFY